MAKIKKLLILGYYFIKTLVFYRPFIKKALGKFIFINPISVTPRSIIIGNNVVIYNAARIEGVTKYEGVSYNPEIIIMDEVKIQQNLHLTCARKISIGKLTAIAANVSITDIDHGYEDINTAPEKQSLYVQDVTIGENCKIFNNAVILPGTVLGRHNIVGANSVVRGQYPDYCVIVGAPAKIVKRYDEQSKSWKKTDSQGNFKN